MSCIYHDGNIFLLDHKTENYFQISHFDSNRSSLPSSTTEAQKDPLEEKEKPLLSNSTFMTQDLAEVAYKAIQDHCKELRRHVVMALG